MTIEKVRLRVRGESEFNTVHPETNTDMVFIEDGYSLQDYLDETTNIKVEAGILKFKNAAGEYETFASSAPNDGFKIGNVTGLKTTNIGTSITVSWNDPNDLTIKDNSGVDVTLAKWGGTKLVYKIGSYPVDVYDGTTLVDNKVKGKYATTGFKLDNAVMGTQYYFMLFPYNTTDLVTDNTANGIIGTLPPVLDTTGSPGNAVMLGGSASAGYFGVVPSSALITGDALATAVGITAGTSQNSAEGWLKFIIDGKIIFVAKKTIRHSTTWNHINAVGAVLGTKIIYIAGNGYKVRLMKGALTNPSKDTATEKGAIGSEWNRLMLPIHTEAPNNWAYPEYGGVTEDWGIKFTDADLLTHRNHGNGAFTLCQETPTSYPTDRVERGGNGISNTNSTPASYEDSFYGWRPVLEFIPPYEDTSGSPGATKTVAGNSNAGYFGVVPSSALITGDALSIAVGISAGTAQHGIEWLKFIIDGKIIFVAKKAIRHTVSWDQINAVGAAVGSKTVAIAGKTYKVRLMKGARNNPSAYGDADREAIGSEWNRLMLPIHTKAPNKWAYPDYAGVSEDWGIKFTDVDLLTNASAGNGAYNWCQETTEDNLYNRVNRGVSGVEFATRYPSSQGTLYHGWRPVLELV